MKIGIFDSGLGGLFTMKALMEALPEYDYVYLGDTKRVPYGSRSHEAIFEFLKEGVDFLFAEDCALIIIACNTMSAEALGVLQKEYLQNMYPDKRVLGMIVPIVEACAGLETVGLIGTEATITSAAYDREFHKQSPETKVISLATPLLVPLIEHGGTEYISNILTEYLSYFNYKKIDALILGCTHYAIIESEVRRLLSPEVKIISQTSILPEKTRDYLVRHLELESLLSKNCTRRFCVTDITEHFKKTAEKWFGKEISLELVSIEK